MSKKNNDLVTLIGQVNQLNLILKNMGECIARLSETIALKHKDSTSSDYISKHATLFCSKTKFIEWMDKKCQSLVYHARDLEGYGEELEKEFEEGENQ